jgi:hypothetical protein
MRRFLLALGVLLGVFAVVVAPAGIASAKPIKNSKKNQVSGPFTGTGTYDSSPTSICSLQGSPFVSQEFDGTYIVPKGGGTGSFKIQGCVDPTAGPNTLPFVGAFAFVTTPAGVNVSGPVVGAIGTLDGSVNLTLSLSGAGGTATTVTLTGTWTTTLQPGVPTPISGTLTTS